MNRAPLRSMTGFASVRQSTSAGELTVSLRSVNHRGLDLHFYLNGELAPFENTIRALLKKALLRGHVEVRVSLASEPENGGRIVTYNRELVARYLAAFRQASADFHLNAEPELTRIFSMPGVLEVSRESKQPGEGFADEIGSVFIECARLLNEVRAREGQELKRAILVELDQLEAGTGEIAAVREDINRALFERLRDRLQILLQGAPVSESRLLEEVAVQVDRSDVQEELTRLQVHAAELRRILEAGGEAGKRLDFLLQEINRETNTILSKSSTVAESGLAISSIGIALKANIERMREQALNLE